MKLNSYALKGKRKLRVYPFFLPLYKISYYIYIGETVKDAAYYADQDFKGSDLVDGVRIDTNAQAVQMSHADHGVVHLMLLKGVMENPSSVIAHEALHISWDICERFGILLSPENHEAQAYILQEIHMSAELAHKDYLKRYKIK